MDRNASFVQRSSNRFSTIILVLFFVVSGLQGIGISTAQASTPVTAGYRDYSWQPGIATPTGRNQK
jgi:hypothetical protein